MKKKELNEERMLRNVIVRSSMARGVPLHRREFAAEEKKIYDDVKLRNCTEGRRRGRKELIIDEYWNILHEIYYTKIVFLNINP